MNRWERLWRWICGPYRRWQTRRMWADAVKRGAEQLRKLEDERILEELKKAANEWSNGDPNQQIVYNRDPVCPKTRKLAFSWDPKEPFGKVRVRRMDDE